ncbi:MAG: TraR/DksA C4-type zinc finger protein [Parvularculaceae bacterium]
MSDGLDIEAMRTLLKTRREELVAHSAVSADARKVVELDQQSVGRVSRQDAMQQQAMANAQEARRAREVRRIDAALRRLSNGEFGSCANCGEQIEPQRLQIDPATLTCADCAR